MSSVRVHCNSGISALSAFSTGYGAAVALDLQMVVDATEGKPPEDPAIARTLEFLSERFQTDNMVNVRVVEEIPQGIGLKSSSALTLCVVESFLRIKAIDIPTESKLSLSAEASLSNGTSITGAFDDAAASALGGLCITDNTGMRIISRRQIEENPVLIVHSPARRKTSSLKDMDFSSLRKIYDDMFEMLGEGRWIETACLNGFVLGSLLGIDHRAVGEMFLQGAEYSSQCGKGPAVFGIFRDKDLAARASMHFSSEGYATILTRFTNSPMVVELD